MIVCVNGVAYQCLFYFFLVMSLLGFFFLASVMYRRKDHLRHGRQNATASVCGVCRKTDERKGLKFSVTG
jgi:hypothetical protein